MKWTKEQEKAITETGQNIIVSAGAGSGKTAVLTERVVRKVKSGIDIDKLLVLTFTKAAAAEMKERIKIALSKDESLKAQLDLLDNSYITNFDSFSISIVQKYYYLLGISSDISIINETVLLAKKEEYIDEVFEELYEKQDRDFLSLIKTFVLKSERQLKKEILSISDKISLLYDEQKYLDNYLEKHFSREIIENNFKLYENFVLKQKDKYKVYLDELSLEENEEFYEQINNILKEVLSSSSYDELLKSKEIKFPNSPRGSSEELKALRAKMVALNKELNSYLTLTKEEHISAYLSTKEYVSAIVKIIDLLNQKLNQFKRHHNRYDFSDIAKMSIKLLRDFPEVAKDLKSNFVEVMIDEYQDTSDLQEELLKLITENNLYMVGDIKQSIYQFRNANPELFKSKYINYSKLDGGLNISLQNNFRSRSEVIEDINQIFEKLMTSDKAGIDYSMDQAMIFGNESYNQEDITDRHMKILNIANASEDKVEDEIFTMLRDIKYKIDTDYQVLDKKTGKLRTVKYSDFAILIDRSKHFEQIKQIFEHYMVPVEKYSSTKILDYDEIYIIKNILRLIYLLETKDFSQDFKYVYMSIARSFLYRLSDDEIFKNINEGKLFDSEIIKKASSIQKDIDILTVSLLYERIVSDFDFIRKLANKAEVEDSVLRLDYITDIASECDALNYDYLEFLNLIELAIEKEFTMEVNKLTPDSNSVSLRTLHSSKGLEYPICYFPFINSKFNKEESQKKFNYHSHYGIISPYFEDGLRASFYRRLFINKETEEDLAERIRLFYVALTRAREEINIITHFDLEKTYEAKEQPNSFEELLYELHSLLSKHSKEINFEELEMSKDYLLLKEGSNLDKIAGGEKLEIVDTKLNADKLKERSFSKSSFEIISSEESRNIELGNKLHYLLEMIDLKNPNLEGISPNDKKILEAFLSLDLNFDKATIYQEYEFFDEDNDEFRHGIIDLILDYEDEIKIIDYKLKNTVDSAYLSQLHSYRDYLSKKSNKKLRIYLYSLIDESLVELS